MIKLFNMINKLIDLVKSPNFEHLDVKLTNDLFFEVANKMISVKKKGRKKNRI